MLYGYLDFSFELIKTHVTQMLIIPVSSFWKLQFWQEACSPQTKFRERFVEFCIWWKIEFIFIDQIRNFTCLSDNWLKGFKEIGYLLKSINVRNSSNGMVTVFGFDWTFWFCFLEYCILSDIRVSHWWVQFLFGKQLLW